MTKKIFYISPFALMQKDQKIKAQQKIAGLDSKIPEKHKLAPLRVSQTVCFSDRNFSV
jgi:hypothetical protein